MTHKDLIDLLLDNPLTLSEIARRRGATLRDVQDDLRHLLRSLVHTDYRAEVEPAECRKCGFQIHSDRLNKPSKCPRCRSMWITEPIISILSAK